MPVVELVPHAMAAGGEAVARDDDGRVVFVRGALPGERMAARLTGEKSRHARAEVIDVLSPSPDRRTPPCPHVAAGCGGCDWQHIEPGAAATHRRQIVADTLSRLGGIDRPVVELGPPLPSHGYRTSVRAMVVGGRAGFHRWASREGIAVDSCHVAHPLVAELIADGRYDGATEVMIRAGARTGERLVVARPTAAGVSVPDDVVVVGADELASGRRAWFHEEVAGRLWRVSADSFFQCRPDGAEALVAEVARRLAGAGPGPLVDLCAGVGLFAGTVGAGRRVVAVERNRSSVADARHNLSGIDARVVRSSFERWRPSAAQVVVADPARQGLGRAGVAAVAATGAGHVVLVSCDPASLGRDAGLLRAQGYEPFGSTVVDLFGHTSHVEVVSGFAR